MNETKMPTANAADPSAAQRDATTSIIATVVAVGFMAPCVWPRHGLLFDEKAWPLMFALLVIAVGAAVFGVLSGRRAKRAAGATKIVGTIAALACFAVFAAPGVAMVGLITMMVAHLFGG